VPHEAEELLPGSSPAVVAAASYGEVAYNRMIARDQVKFVRDNRLPILFVDLEPS